MRKSCKNCLFKTEKLKYLSLFPQNGGKNHRNYNTIPHNPLLFDSGLSEMLSKKTRAQEVHWLLVPLFDLEVN